MTSSRKTVGILALQGDFDMHRNAVERAGAHAVEVRTAEDLEKIDGLIIPGGESTSMLKVIQIENLFQPLKDFGARKAIFGTCAGAILLATEVTNPQQESLGLMDIGVERNGYGRQLDSRVTHLRTEDGVDLEAVFIRAPIIRNVGAGAKVLARYQGDPVLVEQGKHLAATFHPELTDDIYIHKRFIDKLD